MSPTAKHIDKIADEPVAMQYQMPTIQTARQLRMDAMRFDEHKTFATTEEDLEQDSADGQVPVFQKTQRTVDAPLVQHIVTQDDDLRWLRPDDETQVMIEYVPQVMEEIEGSCAIDPTGACSSAAHSGADCSRPRPAGRGRNSESGPDHSQESISNRIIDRIVDVPVVKRRQALSIQTVQKMSEVPQIQRHWSSRCRRQSRCSAAAHRQGG